MSKTRPRLTPNATASSRQQPTPLRDTDAVPTAAAPAEASCPERTRPAGKFLVVGIGASAGGLEACRKFVATVPADTGIAYVLVQHLDPAHGSMMVDLLSDHTKLTVCQATDGLAIEGDHLYVIPPGTYLSTADGKLCLSPPQANHGARLPFDFLLRSLAQDYGAHAVGVVLSGTGTDGTLGTKAVKEAGGLVIAQDPAEASYDGMPKSAIGTGLVDFVLPAARISSRIVEYATGTPQSRPGDALPLKDTVREHLSEIIELLRANTNHDFTLYKHGTLERRIERRMAMAGVEAGDGASYLDLLKTNKAEIELLAKDLLINVTSFFRDPKVFAVLEQKIVPELLRNHPSGRPIRVWIAGCSSGEEAYSLAIVFRERLAAASLGNALQIFASDVDPEAVESAREGLYAPGIETSMSQERLARYFRKEKQGYRVSPDLRSTVVFTVQDVLTDPPFSRLDFVSCRNLLIYLRPEAQLKAISVFHFALNANGLLLLGSAETVGNADSYFSLISKSERLYRRIGQSRLDTMGAAKDASWSVRAFAGAGQGKPAMRQTAIAELCQRMVMEAFAPAAVLINRNHECLYSLGPTDRYLRVPPGQPTFDLLAMVSESLRSKLKHAIVQASEKKEQVSVTGALKSRDGHVFAITVQPAPTESEDLLLICFIDEPDADDHKIGPVPPSDTSKVAELERELELAKAELRDAVRNLQISGEEQKAINEEALSVNEEFQSTNEELLTSKEELQSLNEELTALNTQLQETLERQRETSDDLQNILYSTNVATLFLDPELNIRFFTPATKLLFNIIPGDIGRPLADLNSLSADSSLTVDARTVLHNLAPIDREVEALGGVWFTRRILPYHAHDGTVEGVVITFTDITERIHSAKALEEAKQQAELANVAKSRFLAAASHDLRQPLQTLALLQGLLAKMVVGENAQRLVARLDLTLGAISGMLNTLLDLNQIEAGTVRTEMVSFPIGGLLERMRDEFVFHAESQGLQLHVVRSSQIIVSDPHLLEQMIRNLLSNALKYTEKGKVLLGCRRRNGKLSIEVCDTGIGIPTEELKAIFDEYHQIGNAARERSRGLGLGLSIVQRLGTMLGHPVHVRSRQGVGSVFSIEVNLEHEPVPEKINIHRPLTLAFTAAKDAGTILIVEDDTDVCELLELLLKNEGHRVAAVRDGLAAVALLERGAIRPDLIIADYNLPNGMDGLEVIARLRETALRNVPAIILTGDITTGTLRRVARQNCVQLNKPMKPAELLQVIARLLPVSKADVHAAAKAVAPVERTKPVIFIVDDNDELRSVMRATFEAEGHTVEDFVSCELFLEAYHPGTEGCLLIDAYLPGMGGLELLQRLQASDNHLPSIMITGNSDVSMAVLAMKAGASDFLEKPINANDLLSCVHRALEQSKDATKLSSWHAEAAERIASLTPQQRRIMDMVLAGDPSKNIAADLGISQRTVENHRAAIMTKTGAKSLPALARLALAATPEKSS
ncbi:MAG: chemotaxis protein CheB [Rhizomicrobium sp.]|nr:chemotaxis protein CheB [Rhizomicrobium sp.]